MGLRGTEDGAGEVASGDEAVGAELRGGAARGEGLEEEFGVDVAGGASGRCGGVGAPTQPGDGGVEPADAPVIGLDNAGAGSPEGVVKVENEVGAGR